MPSMRLLMTVKVLFLFTLAFAFAASAQSQYLTPYAQADTSSPRATLQTFLNGLEENLANDRKAFLSYINSDRLYPNEAEIQLWSENDQIFLRGLETMDLSGLPSGFVEALAVEKIVLLIEILSRIDIPPLDDVPTHEELKAASETSWLIPNTRIEIALIERGPREGEYVFSARTILRLEEFRAALVSTPYKYVPTKQYVEAMKPYTNMDSIYATYSNTIDGFGLVPLRWLFEIPLWFYTEVFGVAAWKLAALLLYGSIGYLLARMTRSITQKSRLSHRWSLFSTGLVVSLLAWFVIPLCATYHISGAWLYGLGIVSVIALYLVGAWTAFMGASALAETVIRFQSLHDGGIDSQLIRLGARMAGLVIAMALLIEGADELGLPSYSVVAGIGVSGLAIAFASRETLANLLGSMVILMEKPFRSGQWIKIGDAEGVVEYIGFRSTRIRTSGDSVLSIPNGTLVNSVVDNLGLRNKRQQRFKIQISYETPRTTVEAFLDGIRKIISEHPTTDNDVFHIYLNEFGEAGLNVLLYFYIRVGDYGAELQEREHVLLKILELSEELGIEFVSHQDIEDEEVIQSALPSVFKTESALSRT